MDVMTHDVTQRMEDPRQLAFERRLLEAIVESNVDAILVVSTDRRIIYYNQRFLEMWGVPEEVMAEGSSAAAMRLVQDKLVDPDAFAQRAEFLYSEPLEQSHEELLFRDGRVLERFTGPVTDDDGN